MGGITKECCLSFKRCTCCGKRTKNKEFCDHVCMVLHLKAIGDKRKTHFRVRKDFA